VRTLSAEDIGELFEQALDRALPLFLQTVAALSKRTLEALVAAVFAVAQKLAPLQLYPVPAAQLSKALTCGIAAVHALVASGRLAEVALSEAQHISLAGFARGFAFCNPDATGAAYLQWAVFWARQSPFFERRLSEEFAAALTEHLRPARIVGEWARFELASSENRRTPRLADIYGAAKAASPTAVKSFFKFVAQVIAAPPVLECMSALVPEIFHTETVATRSLESVFAAVLAQMDGDIVLALYAVACDLIDLASGDGRGMAMRAALIIECRPDLRDVLLESFPIQERATLVEADLPYLAELLFPPHSGEHRRFYADRTSDDDEELGLAEMFDGPDGDKAM
jgi:hypothetical protein